MQMQIHQTYSNIFEVSEGPIFVGKVWGVNQNWFWCLTGDMEGKEIPSGLTKILNSKDEDGEFIRKCIGLFIAAKDGERKAVA